jgi:MoaA/NifB/PqqE/SkfB family radical SAM enzyme
MEKGDVDAKRKGIWRSKVLTRLALSVVPLPKNTFCSIDVTHRCNLRCRHCYFFSYDQDRGPELSVDEWLSRIETMQTGKRPFFSCTWVGGEPLLRKELIEKGRRFFKSNRVVTNGTLPIPAWSDCEFHVSVDGTQDLHDSIRGSGCYERMKKNVLDAGKDGIDVTIACCINRQNASCIDDLVDEWRAIGNVKHMLFDFFTPIRGVKEDLWLSFDERDRIVDHLKSLYVRYPGLIGAPPATFDLMLEKNRHKAIGKSCVFLNHGTAFDAWGNIKKPCVIGEKADCDRCGCIVPFSIKAWKHPSNLLKEAWQEIFK